MFTRRETEELLRALLSLPDEKARAVFDFVDYLKTRYARQTAIDQNDAWSDEDIRDLTAAVLHHAAAMTLKGAP